MILGVNSYTHDTATALITDREPVLLLEEERFTRCKHEDGFVFGGGPPHNALQESLALAEPSRYAHVRRVDHSGADHNLSQLRFLEFARRLDPTLANSEMLDHHECHAASAFFCSGHDDSYVCTLDSQGDGLSGTINVGRTNRLERLFNVPACTSVCHIYTHACEVLGLGRRREGSLMALATFGERSDLLPRLFEWTGHGITIGGVDALEARGSAARDSFQEMADIALSIQRSFENVVVAMLDAICEDKTVRRLALAGGGFLNCSLVGRLATEGRWDDVFVSPAAGDSGAALGAALLATGDPSSFSLSHTRYGSAFGHDQVGYLIREYGLAAEPCEPEHVAGLLVDGAVGGLFDGAMEFGPRALGSRSILGDPRSKAIRDRINKIKRRQPWRPVAPAILAEHGPDWLEYFRPSPYMTMALPVSERMIDEAPGVVAGDMTARFQSVSDDGSALRRIIMAFRDATGVPLVANTSLNVLAPLVRTPTEAIGCMFASGLDFLISMTGLL